MGQVEFQHEPLLSGAPEPLVSDFPQKVDPLSSNPETDSVDVNSVLNSEGVLVIDSEYSGWEPDSDPISSYDQKNPSRFKRIMSKAALPAAGVISSVAIACGGGGDGAEVAVTSTSTLSSEETVVVEKTPTQTPTATATEAEAETPTEEAVTGKPGPEETVTAPPTVENTPTPEPTEVVQEAPCQILPEEICKNAEVFLFKTGNGDEQLLMLGFKNVPTGTPIMAPSNATINPIIYGENNGWKGMGALIDLGSDTTNPGLIIGDIGFASRDTKTVNGGEVITTIQGSGFENSGYNLLVTFGTRSENGLLVSNEELYESLFPGITSKEPIGVFEQKETEVVLTANHYID